jgi:hypothetical protein
MFLVFFDKLLGLYLFLSSYNLDLVVNVCSTIITTKSWPSPMGQYQHHWSRPPGYRLLGPIPEFK